MIGRNADHRPATPWEGHPEDVLWSDGYHPPSWPLRIVAIGIVLIFILLSGAGILWK